GLPGIRVDGGDVLAVFDATREALTRAREGGGPTFIEALTYRAAPHATADDPGAYIDVDRVEAEKERECVGRYNGYLRRLGLLTDELIEEIKAEATQLMREGIAQAEAEPPPGPELLFEHAFANPPASFTSDLAELKTILDG
ncbi:MAG: thiamine pyrophosphate-dependent enzyme, partial [Gaiellaceae bacterium]